MLTASAFSVAIWVCFPKLSIEYYKPSVLQDLRQAIGPVLRIDAHMTSETRGQFTRICIQVNLANLFIKIIKIGGVEQPVQYEGINSLCFSCGRVGHKVESCSYTAKASEKGGEDKAKGTDPTVINHSTSNEETYGPWVLISRKKQSTRKGHKDLAHTPQFSSTQ